VYHPRGLQSRIFSARRSSSRRGPIRSPATPDGFPSARSTDLDDLDKAQLSRVPQRYDPVLNPIQVGDKVTAREMLLDDQGEVLAKPGQRLVVMDRDGAFFLLANGQSGRGRALGSKLRKGYVNQADLEVNESNVLPGVEEAWPDEEEEEVPAVNEDEELDEDGNPVRYISPEDEESLNSLKRYFFQCTGEQIEDFHDEQVRGD
jgi:hypothetical protein